MAMSPEGCDPWGQLLELGSLIVCLGWGDTVGPLLCMAQSNGRAGAANTSVYFRFKTKNNPVNQTHPCELGME